MKRLILFIFAATLCLTATAQQMQELTSWDQTLKSQLTEDQLKQRSKAKPKQDGIHIAGDAANSPTITAINPSDGSKGKVGLDILPDKIYAGEPFEVHYKITPEVMATYELYDLRSRRPKQMATKRISTSLNGSTVLRITLDEPGKYEVVAYDAERLQDFPYPELLKSRWEIVVHQREAPANE